MATDVVGDGDGAGDGAGASDGDGDGDGRDGPSCVFSLVFREVASRKAKCTGRRECAARGDGGAQSGSAVAASSFELHCRQPKSCGYMMKDPQTSK